MKRLEFLKLFLKLFGVQEIELIDLTLDSIRGFAIYDKSTIEERQEFIWHKSENQSPPIELNILIEKIIINKLNTGDKISAEIHNLKFEKLSNAQRDELIKQLFDIEIKMIDNGIETDSFFVHD